VFTTAYSEYAIEGYKVDAVDYLLKPFGLDDFQRAANKVLRQYELIHGQHTQTSEPSPTLQEKDEDDILFVKTDYKVVRLSISKIRYVEAMSEYLRLYMEDEPKPITALLSMKKMEERLPQNFMRIHRSYIVNLLKIQEVARGRVLMDEKTYLPVGDNYKNAFNDFLEKRSLMK
jgi:DNA-binding LytR/AlgR family response regulator